MQDELKNIREQMILDQAIRKAIVKSSHKYFFTFYFGEYIKYLMADFQVEMLELSEKDDDLFVMAFRGSAKSTIFTTSYPLWAMLGKQQKKFIVICSQTLNQSKSHINNIKMECERNELLKKDLGPFKEEADEWGNTTLTFPLIGAKIVIASIDQTIRGMRHGANRPDLIILDDIEDTGSVKNSDIRTKVKNWFSSEITPLGDINTRIIVVGNLLHPDSLLMDLKEQVLSGRRQGMFREYPLLDEEGKCLWPGKYPAETEIEKLRSLVQDNVIWHSEYLLKIVSSEEQIVKPEWMQYYDNLPDEAERITGVGVDLAISKETHADKTSFVMGRVYGTKKDPKIYILAEMFNGKIDAPQTLEKLKLISSKNKRSFKVYIEGVAYQTSMAQFLVYEGVNAVAVTIHGDKFERLNNVSHLIQNGNILFPRPTTPEIKELINQIINLGSQRYDDLADAFTLLISSILEDRLLPVNNQPKYISTSALPGMYGTGSISSRKRLL